MVVSSSFPAILGNPQVRESLARCRQADAVYPSYLFLGPEGLGKQLTALWYAAALNCSGAEPPCGSCPSCRKILAGQHPDVSVLRRQPDKTRLGVGEIREGISQASYRPYEGRYRIWIIDEAERLTEEAQNSLLKTLEEPPGKLMIVLVCANQSALLPTVVSRCRPVQFRPVDHGELVDFLVRQGQSPERADVLARLCEGRVGEALGYHRSPALWELRENAIELSAELAGADLWGAIRTAQALEGLRSGAQDARGDLERVLRAVGSLYRDLMLVGSGCADLVVNVHHRSLLEASKVGREAARLGLERIAEAEEQLSQNVLPRLLLQRLCLRLSKMD